MYKLNVMSKCNFTFCYKKIMQKLFLLLFCDYPYYLLKIYNIFIVYNIYNIFRRCYKLTYFVYNVTEKITL